MEEELNKINISQKVKEELEKNAVYLDLFKSKSEDFGLFLKKILDMLRPEIEKLKDNKFKDSIFWEEFKSEDIKRQVLDSIKKYKLCDFFSAFIAIPILDIYADYKIREYMFDKIADIYKDLLVEKIPDNYKDPDVRKIVARASKYTLLRKDGSFTPKGKYKNIYEKLKK